jgi:hypothetical protein
MKAVIYLVIFSISFVGTSCGSAKNYYSPKVQYEEIYINQFKLTYFRQLLAKSYNGSKAIYEIISSDHSGFTEPILTEEDFRIIDSLTTIDNQRLVADSADGKRRAEGAQGKRPFGYIIDKFTSMSLGSIAKQRLKASKFPGN